jgi:phage FluMu protein Com
MNEPVMIKGMNFAEMIKEVQQKGIEAKKKLEENEGRCVNCNKNMANPNSSINQFRCDECNKVTEDLLQQLKGPGFVGMRVPIP